MRITHHLLSVFVFILLFSCSSEENYFEDFVGTNQGIFRGSEMGDSAEKVKKLEKLTPDNEEGEEYLHYHYEWKDNQQYTLEYSFDDEGLYEIEATAYITCHEAVGDLYNQLKTHYTKKYGIPKHDDDSGVTVWSVASGNSQKTDITIVEDSERGELSISIIDNDILLNL